LLAGESRPSRFGSIRCTLVSKFNLFVLEVVKAWTDPAQKNPKTIHHRGNGKFAVDGDSAL
jgi:hypothetical protein